MQDRLQALHEAKARALVREHWGVGDVESLATPGGIVLVDGDRLWLYVTGSSNRVLGRGLVLAAQHQATEVHVLVERTGSPGDDGVPARQGALLVPPVQLWQVEGQALTRVEAAPLPVVMDPPAGVEPLLSMLRAAGTEIVTEHGVIHGEVNGLEVARIRVGDDGRPTLDVGVGRFDQEATALLHGHLPTADALARAVTEIRRHRSPGAVPHPVNRLARERWLRAQLLADPSLIGLDELEAVSPPVPRMNVRDPQPAAAIGVDPQGRRVLVLSSVGVDLDLVPIAADLVARDRPDRVIFVTPARDQMPVQHMLAARLAVPVEFAAVEGSWPA